MLKKESILGLHILQTLQPRNKEQLLNYKACICFIDWLLLEYNLEKVGESHFIFDNNSFTTGNLFKRIAYLYSYLARNQ
ncbi:MAG: hypothetical protein HC854_04130 [Flavobacterium sp.]|nr:hypothetical protein [Flavobacterium sp.]